MTFRTKLYYWTRSSAKRVVVIIIIIMLWGSLKNLMRRKVKVAVFCVTNNAWNWFPPHVYVSIVCVVVVAVIIIIIDDLREWDKLPRFDNSTRAFNCTHSTLFYNLKINFVSLFFLKRSFNAQLVSSLALRIELRHTIERERERKIKLRKCHKANNWKFPFTVLSFTLRSVCLVAHTASRQLM